jgi:rod shape-determining protein MreD
MKKNLSLMGLIFFSLVVQTTVLAQLPHQLAKPDLLLILTVYLGLFSSPLGGATLALFSGYLMDVFSGSIFGIHAFSKTAIFFSTILIRDRFYIKSPLFQGAIIFSLSLIEGFIIISILGLVSPIGNFLPSFFTFIIPKSLITGLVGPFFMPVIRYVSLIPQGGAVKQ